MFHTIELSRRYRILMGAAIAGTMLLFAGCASAPTAPPASMAQAKQAIEVAESEDASHYAGAELDEARQKLLSAERAFAAEDMIRADRMAQQSAVTAELAAVRTEAEKAAEINEEMNRGIKALTEEMRRAEDKT